MDEKFDRDVYISAFAVNVYVVHGTKIYIYSAFMEMTRTSLYIYQIASCMAMRYFV